MDCKYVLIPPIPLGKWTATSDGSGQMLQEWAQQIHTQPRVCTIPSHQSTNKQDQKCHNDTNDSHALGLLKLGLCDSSHCKILLPRECPFLLGVM